MIKLSLLHTNSNVPESVVNLGQHLAIFTLLYFVQQQILTQTFWKATAEKFSSEFVFQAYF